MVGSRVGLSRQKGHLVGGGRDRSYGMTRSDGRVKGAFSDGALWKTARSSASHTGHFRKMHREGGPWLT